MSCTRGRVGSTSSAKGTSSATLSAQSVSTLGLPVPDSSSDSVDLAMPARLATSARDNPVRRRSRRSDAAMTSNGALLLSAMFAPSVYAFDLTNASPEFIIEDYAFDMANTRSRPGPDCGAHLPRRRGRRRLIRGHRGRLGPAHLATRADVG